MTPLLVVDDVVTEYQTPHRTVRALDGASLSVERGETVGVVGESGSGKSTLGLLVGRLLPSIASHPRGRVMVDGDSVLELPASRIARLRAEKLAFIPQDPVGSLNPTLRIGRQLKLALPGRPTARADLVRQLDRVQINDPERVLRLYPHEISGGMAQRVVVAMAMARRPSLLIADEPTASLDGQVREEIHRLVFGLAAEAGTTILWLSHDLHAVSRWCERVAVMYGGRVVEDGLTKDVLGAPRHPYTIALSTSDPARTPPGERLVAISGSPPVLTPESEGCAFAPRCGSATADCRTDRPAPVAVAARTVLCHYATDPDALHPVGATERTEVPT